MAFIYKIHATEHVTQDSWKKSGYGIHNILLPSRVRLSASCSGCQCPWWGTPAVVTVLEDVSCHTSLTVPSVLVYKLFFPGSLLPEDC